MPGDEPFDHFQTQTQIRRLLEQAGVPPRKRYGQNFLIDRNLMHKLIEAAEIEPSDCVLEVGTGTGSLTGLLAEVAGKVISVEIDPRLYAIAENRLGDDENVNLLNTDALEKKSRVSGEMIETVYEELCELGGRLMLVANLPYDIATPLVIDLLLLKEPIFSRMCFTVQAEVAERFLAEPGTAGYGPVSVVVQALTRPKRICKAPAKAFWPPPRVESTMLRLDVLNAWDQQVGNRKRFSARVREFFLHRRKAMAHSSRRDPYGEKWPQLLAEIGLDPMARPENVTVSQWIELDRRLA